MNSTKSKTRKTSRTPAATVVTVDSNNSRRPTSLIPNMDSSKVCMVGDFLIARAIKRTTGEIKYQRVDTNQLLTADQIVKEFLKTACPGDCVTFASPFDQTAVFVASLNSKRALSISKDCAWGTSKSRISNEQTRTMLDEGFHRFMVLESLST